MTEPDPGTPPRLRRKEAKARTRELLLDAATRVFARKGYAGASVDDIAEAAGFTIGALYSNFSGKEDLFIELLSARSSTRMADALAIVGDSDAPIEQRRSRLADHLVEVAAQDADLAVLEAEFWLYAMRKPDFHERLTAQFRENRDSLAALLADWAQDQGRSGAIPFEGLSTILLALFQGLVKLRRTDPALVPDDLDATAIRWVFGGLTAQYGRDSSPAPAIRPASSAGRDGNGECELASSATAVGREQTWSSSRTRRRCPAGGRIRSSVHRTQVLGMAPNASAVASTRPSTPTVVSEVSIDRARSARAGGTSAYSAWCARSRPSGESKSARIAPTAAGSATSRPGSIEPAISGSVL